MSEIKKYCFNCLKMQDCFIYDTLIASLDKFRPHNMAEKPKIKNAVLEYLSGNCSEFKENEK